MISVYRAPIYGFAIFWITLFHAYAINRVDYSFGHRSLALLRTILNNGSVGVDCFLFLSGVCLYFSLRKDPDILRFEKKRLRRVILPVLLIDLWYWMMLLIYDRDLKAFIYRITLTKFWIDGDQSIWFVSLILILYLVYPFIYSFIFKKDDDSSAACRTVLLMVSSYCAIIIFAHLFPVRFALTEIAITRIPAFLIGCGYGKIVYEKRETSRQFIIIPVMFVVLFIAVTHFELLHSYNKRFFFLIGGIGVAYSLAFIFDALTKGGKRKSLITDCFSKLGAFSLEIYLSAGVWNQLLRRTSFYEMGTLPLYLAMLVIAYLFAYLAYRIEQRINNN